MPQKALKNLFNQVHFSMAQQDIRYYLNGLLLVLEPGRVRAVATDGHRLAHGGVAVDGQGSTLDVIIPRKTIHEKQRLSSAEDQDAVQFDVDTGQLRFGFDASEVDCKTVEGEDPDFGRVIPSCCDRNFDIARDVLQAALHRTAILTTDK